jgi:hypothetical protein
MTEMPNPSRSRVIAEAGMAIYNILALAGWFIALFLWDDPPIGFEIVVFMASIAAMVFMIALFTDWINSRNRK